MSHEQFLHTARRRAEPDPHPRSSRPPRPVPPLALLEEYYTDPWRARLSGNAFLVWIYLLVKADPESRIATVSHWDIKLQTGIRSNRSLGAAVEELQRYRYCTSWDIPTAPYYPRNYKIPEHIGSAQMPEALALELHRQAEQARKRRSTAGKPNPQEHDWYAGVDLKAFARPAEAHEMERPLEEIMPAPAMDPASQNVLQPGLPGTQALDQRERAQVQPAAAGLDLNDLEHLDFDQEIERLEKEIEEIGKALSRK